MESRSDDSLSLHSLRLEAQQSLPADQKQDHQDLEISKITVTIESQ